MIELSATLVTVLCILLTPAFALVICAAFRLTERSKRREADIAYLRAKLAEVRCSLDLETARRLELQAIVGAYQQIENFNWLEFAASLGYEEEQGE